MSMISIRCSAIMPRRPGSLSSPAGTACRKRTRCSLRSACRHAAATDMLISAMSARRPERSLIACGGARSSSPSRQCRSAPAARSSALSERPIQAPMSPSPRTLNFCAGAAIYDLQHPNHILVGTEDERARKVLGEVYRPLYLNQVPIMYFGRRTAGLIKYTANAFLATKITFTNEITDLAEQVGADVQGDRARHRARKPHRHQLPACPPWLWRLLLSEEHASADQERARPWRAAPHRRGRADGRRDGKRAMVRKVTAAVGGDLHGKTIAVLGLTFKPDTDDMRDAPWILLITGLTNFGAKVKAHDPVGMEQAKQEFIDTTFRDDPHACAAGADALGIVTEWRQFRALDVPRIKAAMKGPIVLDLRNIYRYEEMATMRFQLAT